MNVAAQSEVTVDPREQSISRFELWAIVAITLIGAAVRFALPSAMAIEHFDEGVYASNLLFPDQGFRYPDRHLYAPSLVPALIEWSIILFGDKGIAPMLPSLLFGTLTIPLIWWVGRQWFGPLSGIAAATLLSLSDFHIAFSRSALTDVPLCFWLLLAVYFFERSFRDLSWPTAIFAGLTTGLAWWTKYNGWLPLAISLSGLIGWLPFSRRSGWQLQRRLLLWSAGALASALVWLPYWISLPHGYSEVANNHKQYIVGFAGWSEGVIQQFDAWTLFPGGVGTVIVLLSAWLIAGSTVALSGLEVGTSIVQTATWPTNATQLSVGLSLFGLVTTYFSPGVALLAFGLVGTIASVIVSLSPQELSDRRFPRLSGLRFELGDLLLAAWVVGLVVSTPLYRPYPRLCLPLVIGLHLLGARWLKLVSITSQRNPFGRIRGLIAGGTLIAVVVAFFVSFPNSRPRLPSLAARNELALVAQFAKRTIRDNIQAVRSKSVSGLNAVVYVYAEPGLFFHLPADGLAVQPAGNLSFVDIEATRRLPTFLVTGPHAQRSKAFADEFTKRADQFELIASYPYDASDFVRLDDVSATQLRARREPLEVRLYRVRPPQ